MDPDKQREIASQGGKAAHESGKAHEFTTEEAREAGRKGGQARSSAIRGGSPQDESEDAQSGDQGRQIGKASKGGSR